MVKYLNFHDSCFAFKRYFLKIVNGKATVCNTPLLGFFFFFFGGGGGGGGGGIFCYSQSDDHPQEDLAKIKLNLKSQMLIKKENLLYY
jgi:hypothetical protein